jgi:phage tail protein X
VKIVANPWAEIWIDGKLVETTPVADPIEVETGTHRVVFKNRYFREVERTLEVAEGETPTLAVTLGDRKVAAQAVKPKPAAAPPPQPAPAPILHTVRADDTLDVLAAEYYGKRDFAVFVMLANGIEHPRALKPGDKLTIPTAWKYRVVAGDTLDALATRYLGDARRAEFLAAFNGLAADASLADDDELTIPFHATHVAADREDLASIAAAFYRDSTKAEMLRRYNNRPTGKPLKKGETLIVPIADVHARVPIDRDAERREAKRRQMTARAIEQLARAETAWRAGDYADVKAALLSDLDLDYVEADIAARVAVLLGGAYVAFGDRDSAMAQLKRAHERKPELVLRADEYSPKICDVWRRVGGVVEEPK